MLTAAMLTAVAGLLAGADRLRRAILSAAGQEGRLTEDSVLWPVVSCIKVSDITSQPLALLRQTFINPSGGSLIPSPLW